MKFQVNAIPYLEEETDSVMNIPNLYKYQPTQLFYNALRKHWSLNDITSKDSFLTVFGKEYCCKNYSLKNWIWIFNDDRAIIHCLISSEGISFEYNYVHSKEKDVIKLLIKIIKYFEKALSNER